MVIAQVLKITTEVEDGTLPYRLVTDLTLKPVHLGVQQISNDVEEVKCL